MRSFRNTWQCAVSHIFHVSGVDVQFICSVTDKSSLDMIITGKRIRFLNLLRHHSENDILYNLCMCAVLVNTSCLAWRVIDFYIPGLLSYDSMGGFMSCVIDAVRGPYRWDSPVGRLESIFFSSQ